MMTRSDWLEILDILTGKTERFDEMGWPDDEGEYDINGWPLPITD